MNRQGPEVGQTYGVRLGPPRQIGLSVLKWSFRDLDLKGLHEFPGTLHFVSPGILRNDTGQHLSEGVYVDYAANLLYPLPSVAPGQKINLDTIPSERIYEKGGKRPASRTGRPGGLEETLRESPLATSRRFFVGFSDGPALPVSMDLPHDRNVHSLIVVALEKP
jgi:hypothetical protein